MSFGSAEPRTPADEARIDAIKHGLCIACLLEGITTLFPEAHHLLSGGRRRGHRFTIGLCIWHHRGQCHDGETTTSMTRRYGPSLAKGSKPFHQRYGSDDELLELQDGLLRTWGLEPEGETT